MSYGFTIVAVCFLILLVIFGVQTAFGIFFTPMLAEFGWSKATISGAFSINWVVSGLAGVIIGRYCDRFGSRWIITIAGLLIGAGYILMSLMSAVWHIYLFFGVIIGIGMSGIWLPIVSTVAHWFVTNRNTMTAAVTVGGGLGSLIAPPIASWLIARYEWRTAYIILGGIVFVVVILTAQLLRRPTKTTTSGNGTKQAMKLGTGDLTFNKAFYTRQLWLTSAMMFLFGFPAYLMQVHIAPHATELGFSAASAANILATIGGLTIVGRLVFGNAADRVGNRQVLIIGFFLIAASSLWLLPAREEWALYLFAAVFGLAFGTGITNSALIAELFGMSSHAAILGINVLSYSFGVALGPFAAGWIFDATGSYQIAFIASAVSGLLGLTLTLLLKPIGGKQAKKI